MRYCNQFQLLSRQSLKFTFFHSNRRRVRPDRMVCIYLEYTRRQFVFVDFFFLTTCDDIVSQCCCSYLSLLFSFERSKTVFLYSFSISRLCFDRRPNILRDSLMDIGALNRPIFLKLHRGISVTLILSIDQAEVEENCASR